MISNRGTEVWPDGSAYTDCVNHYRLRFESASATNQSHIVALIGAVASRFTICGAEWLRDIDGKHGYSPARGQSAN
jgi:isocitrate dehydrogenase